MWIFDGTIEFHLGGEKQAQSSVVFHEERHNQGSVNIECFDFGKWVKESFNEEDYVLLSIDIEGSEYEVLNKMLTDGSINHIDRLYVEFGIATFGPPVLGREELLREIANRGIYVYPDSMDSAVDAGVIE